MPNMKSKGVFQSEPYDLRHSLQSNIVAIAIKEYLLTRTPVEQTIHSCTDINDLLLTHAATKGFQCEWNGQRIGKLARWYRSTSPHAAPITKVNTEKRMNVPMAESSIPCQDLPTLFPEDVDYDFYIRTAQELLDKITRPKLSGVNQKVYLLQQLGYRPAVVKTDPKSRPSRASVVAGELDWNAMPDHTEIGIATGKKAGIVALVNDETSRVVALYRFNGNLPPRTRAKIGKDTNHRIVYGQNIRLYGRMPTEPATKLPDGMLGVWINLYYTPGELKKAGVTQ